MCLNERSNIIVSAFGQAKLFLQNDMQILLFLLLLFVCLLPFHTRVCENCVSRPHGGGLVGWARAYKQILRTMKNLIGKDLEAGSHTIVPTQEKRSFFSSVVVGVAIVSSFWYTVASFDRPPLTLFLCI